MENQRNRVSCRKYSLATVVAKRQKIIPCFVEMEAPVTLPSQPVELLQDEFGSIVPTCEMY